MDESLFTEKISPEEESIFTSLRASSWDEFRGQEQIKESLDIAIQAAKKRGDAMEHVLFYGSSGSWQNNIVPPYC